MLKLCDGGQTHSEICYDADTDEQCPLCKALKQLWEAEDEIRKRVQVRS